MLLQVTVVYSTVWNCVAFEVKEGNSVTASARTLYQDHLPFQPDADQPPLQELALVDDGERAVLIRTADEDWGVLVGASCRLLSPAVLVPDDRRCDSGRQACSAR